MHSYREPESLRITVKKIVAIVLMVIATALAGFAQLARVGPVDPTNGFPQWYQDKNGIALDLCLPNAAELAAGLCLLLPADVPQLPIVFPDTFPGEAFYFNATSTMTVNGGKATLIIGQEGAFTLGVPVQGDQIVFARIRFVVDVPPPGGNYRVISPYLEKDFPNVVPGARAIFFTEDVGLTPGDFAQSLNGHIGPFLRPSAVRGGAPLDYIVVGGKTYLADAATLTPVTGSPLGGSKNVFRIEGPNIGGPGIDFIETELFTIMGRVHTAPIPSPLSVDRATYVRDATGGWIDVFATATPGIGKPDPVLSVGAGSIPPVLMKNKVSKFYGQLTLADPQALPATLNVTNNADNPPSVFTANLVDEVNIRKAEYDGTLKRLTIQASSGDKFATPTLIVEGLNAGPLDATGTLVIDNILVPPPTVTVLSSFGGRETATVTSPSIYAQSASGLTATAISDAEVDLAWTDASANETGFRVERASDAAFTLNRQSFTVAANTTTFVDTTTAGVRTYFYRVIAFNAQSDSAPSNVATVTTPAATVPPTITNPGDQTGAVPNAVALQIVAADHPGGNNPLTFSANGLPAGLTINAATGLISGAYSAGGTFNTVVSVSNGQLSASAAFTWTVIAPPRAVSVTPGAGAGKTVNFQAVFADPAGFGAITTAQVLINDTLNPVGACQLQYTPATRLLALMNDAGTAFGAGRTIGTAGTLSNSQCSINVGTASAAGSGQNLTLVIQASFPSAAWGGQKNVYMYAESNIGLNSGWQLNGTWTVPGAVTVTSPNGGESWAAGSIHAVTWTSIGMTEPVNIALLKAGVGFQVIANNVPVAAGSFSWTMPGGLPIANDYTVRIMSSTIPTVLDVSDAPFSTAVPLTVTSPNGGEVWAAGTSHAITWTSSGITGNVNIALLKAGVGFQTIATGIPVGQGTFTWNISAGEPLGNTYTIRITSATNATVIDVSNAPFTIAAPLTVVTPNGGQSWAGGTTHTIQWGSLGITGNVNIALLKAGAAIRTIATNVPVSAGSFAWALPTQGIPAAADYTIRLQSTVNGAILDASDAPFSIIAPVTVLSPNGGEFWAPGSTQTIQWSAPGVAGGTVNIALLKANVGFRAIANGISANTGSFSWTVPTTIPVAADYTIRVMNATDTTSFDVSNAPFAIGAPITVVSPNGGETLVTGSTRAITWTSLAQAGTVSIALLKAGVGFRIIATGVSVTQGSFQWVVPAVPAASDYTVRVMSETNTSVLDVSNAPFTIVPAVTVISPNGGETWKLGSTQTVQWTAPGITGNVDVALLKAGVGLRVIATGVPANAESVAWTVPLNIPNASDYTVRVTSSATGTLVDVSDSPFTIAP